MPGSDAARALTFGEQLRRAARRDPRRPAIRLDGRGLAYGELDERVDRLARALAERGVRPGDRVATLLGNGIEVVETYFAVARLGGICVPVNFRLTRREVVEILRDCEARALVVDSPRMELVPAILAGAPAIASCLGVAPESGEDPGGAEPYEGALAGAAAEAPEAEVAGMDPAFVMYTSGTTGRPKGATLSHWGLLLNTLHTLPFIGRGGDRYLTGLPLFHIGGLNAIGHQVLPGKTLTILASTGFDAETAVEVMEREQITGAYFVPTQWRDICAVPDLGERDLALRTILWGASPSPSPVLEAMSSAFPEAGIFNCFGQTEMSSLTCVLDGVDAVRKQGSIGTPVPGVDLRLVDEGMRDVPRGTPGEIVYRGPTVMLGYWNDPERTENAFAGGWFHSGDMAVEDDEGYLFLVDRKKDMIISGGENIYSTEVEEALGRHPKVSEVAVIGVPHERWIETPLALVVPTDPDDPPPLRELIEWCAERISSYKKPTRLEIVDALPRTASGKVQKHLLRKEFGER